MVGYVTIPTSTRSATLHRRMWRQLVRGSVQLDEMPFGAPAVDGPLGSSATETGRDGKSEMGRHQTRRRWSPATPAAARTTATLVPHEEPPTACSRLLHAEHVDRN